MKTTWMVGVALALALAGCAKSGQGAAASEAGERPEAPLPEAEIAALLDGVPADAIAVATMAAREPLWQTVTTGFLLPMDPQIAVELDAELSQHLERHLGLDVRRAQAAVVFVRMQPPGGALIVQGVGGTMKQKTGEHAGATLWAPDGPDGPVIAHRGELLLLGTEDAVEAALAVASGDAEKMSGPLRTRIDRLREGANLAAVVAVDRVPMVDLLPLPGTITEVSARFGTGGARVAVAGDDAVLGFLEGQMQMIENMALAEARKQKELMADDPAEGAGAILGYHFVRNLAEQVQPVREDGELSVTVPFEGGDAMAFTAVAGVLAAVAIPAFMKYIKKSKTAEAKVMLRAMYDGARAAHAEGAALPDSAGPTPPVGSCCLSGEKCAPDPAQWQAPTWQALRFSMDDPHHYSYEFRKEGSGFTVSAYGDLDCDGVYSTFQMYGEIQGDDVRGTATVSSTDELE